MDMSRSMLSLVMGATLLASNVVCATDITAARQRFAQLLAELEQTKKLVAPKPATIPIAWSTQEETGSILKYYLVSSPNCGACPAAKRNATAAGIDYEVISVKKARSMGLFSATERALVPQLICSEDPANRIVGAHAASKMKSWSATFPIADEPVMTATVHSESSLEVIIECLVAHLSKNGDLPVTSSSLLRKTIITPAFVTEMISQLMMGDKIQIAETGASIEWPGEGRTIQFESTSRITINPPMKVSIKKLGIRLTTTLNSIKINEAGNEVRLGLQGPDLTFRFRHNAK